MKDDKNNETELSYPMNTHELWFMICGLENYIKTIVCDRLETPDYKGMMIHTALKTCKKLKEWIKELDWTTKHDLLRVAYYEQFLEKEKLRQSEKEEQMYGKLNNEPPPSEES